MFLRTSEMVYTQKLLYRWYGGLETKEKNKNKNKPYCKHLILKIAYHFYNVFRTYQIVSLSLMAKFTNDYVNYLKVRTMVERIQQTIL